MRVFRITYNSVGWTLRFRPEAPVGRRSRPESSVIGREAVVVAGDEKEALEILKTDHRSFGAENAEVSEIDLTVPQILYNNDR